MEIMLWYFTLNGLVFSGTLLWYAVTKYDIKKSGREMRLVCRLNLRTI